MRKLVGGADNKCLKCVLRIECVVGGVEIQPSLRRQGRLGWSLGHVDYTDIAEPGIPRGLNDNIDMIVQPILEKRVWNTYVECFVVVFDQLCRLEPGVVTLLIDFLLNDIENLLPG